MAVQIDEINDPDGRRCIRLATAGTEVRLLLDAGPRLVFLGRPDGPNLLYEEPVEAPARQNGWRLIGGHRLWTAPEDALQTYVADNTPVEVLHGADGVTLRGAVEEPTGIRKALGIRMAAGAIQVRHTLEQVVGTSHRAPWAITAFGPGGTVWLPRVTHRPHPDALLPDQSLVLWPYTDLGDPRLELGSGAIRLRHDAQRDTPLKIGAVHPPGWLAWSRDADLVIQHTRHHEGPRADLGATHEVYVDRALSELEALGPLQKLAPGEQTFLEQTWWHTVLPEPVDAEGLEQAILERGLDAAGLGESRPRQ